MANKVALDFESGRIIRDTDFQRGVEIDYELAEKEDAILAAMGYHKEYIDLGLMIQSLAYATVDPEGALKELQEEAAAMRLI